MNATNATSTATKAMNLNRSIFDIGKFTAKQRADNHTFIYSIKDDEIDLNNFMQFMHDESQEKT